MKKTIIALLLLTTLLSSCGGKDTSTDKSKAETSEASQNKSASKAENETKNADKAPQTSSEDKKSNDGGAVKNKDGEVVSVDDLEKLIDKSNEPDVDEETKREILDEIDYILKQAEQQHN